MLIEVRPLDPEPNYGYIMSNRFTVILRNEKVFYYVRRIQDEFHLRRKYRNKRDEWLGAFDSNKKAIAAGRKMAKADMV